jgi:hypothetical protein
LVFQAYDRPLHPEFIESIQVRTFTRDGYELKLHLTPAGHATRWRWRQINLVELLADQTDPMPENRQLFAHRIGGERTERFQPCPRLSYQTCFQVEYLPAELFFRQHDELRYDGRHGGLLLELHPHDRLGLSPLSFVDLQARPGSLLINAYHTFPDDYAIVKTQTLIDLDGAK